MPGPDGPHSEEGLDEDAPELVASQHVDDKVGGRVDSQQEVGDGDDHLDGSCRLTRYL